MLSRFTLSNVARPTTPVVSVAQAQTRNMATLKDLKLRINSTRNIQKITKSMKMIASTKLVRAQRDMEKARNFGKAAQGFYINAGTKPVENPTKTLYIAATSDKGLCGGVHSSISRNIRDIVKNSPDAANISLVAIGDKSKAQLSRLFPNNMVYSFSGLGSRMPSWLEASSIAGVILGQKYDKVSLVSNIFKSVIAYETQHTPIYSVSDILASENIGAYELEDDVLENYQEFSFANIVFAAMAEGHAAEVAAKMTAMDNATRNAGDLIGKLTVIYNRSRQAAITTELVDIITGASAL